MATPQNVLDSLDAMNTAFSAYGVKATTLVDAQTVLTAAQTAVMSAQNIVMGASMSKMTASMAFNSATLALATLQANGNATAQQIADAVALVTSTHNTYISKSNDLNNAQTALTQSQSDVTTAQTAVMTAQGASQTARTASNTALDALVGSCTQTWRLA